MHYIKNYNKENCILISTVYNTILYIIIKYLNSYKPPSLITFIFSYTFYINARYVIMYIYNTYRTICSYNG